MLKDTCSWFIFSVFSILVEGFGHFEFGFEFYVKKPPQGQLDFRDVREEVDQLQGLLHRQALLRRVLRLLLRSPLSAQFRALVEN